MLKFIFIGNSELRREKERQGSSVYWLIIKMVVKTGAAPAPELRLWEVRGFFISLRGTKHLNHSLLLLLPSAGIWIGSGAFEPARIVAHRGCCTNTLAPVLQQVKLLLAMPECWWESRALLRCFRSLLTCLRGQWRMAQVRGLLPPVWKTGWAFGSLALVWTNSEC